MAVPRPSASGTPLSVEELLAQCGQPTLAEIARTNVERIRRTAEEMKRVERDIAAAEQSARSAAEKAKGTE